MRPGPVRRHVRLRGRRHPIKRGLPPRKLGRPRFRKGRDPAFLRWLRRQPCVITGLVTGQRWVDETGRSRVARIQAAHVVSRGAGGVDRGNVVPLDAWLHREQHRIGILTFQQKWGVDLTETARRVDERYGEWLAVSGRKAA